jgi:pilus assembly protein CpaE
MTTFLLRGQNAGAIESALIASMPDLMEISNLNQALEHKSAQNNEPTIVLVANSVGDRPHFDRLVDVAEKLRNQIFLILISDEISASDYKRLIRTGGADWVPARAASREIAEIITKQRAQRVLSAKQSQSLPRTQPVTISFIPSAGGVGNTTLIIESAVCLKTNKASQHRGVCIVDLDFQTSHVCDYLDAEPRLQIAEFANAPERLDEHLLDSFKTHHGSDIDVFAAPRSKFPSEDMDINALDALFTMIAKRYDLILVDFPLPWFNWTAQVIAASDGVVVTGLNTIPNLRQLAETLSLVHASAPSLKIGIALNRCEKSFFGSVAGRKQVERVLPNEELFFIANHGEAIEGANMGVPMTLGPAARKMRDEFAGLAKFCADLKSARVAAV